VARTSIPTSQIRDVGRDDMITATSGQAVTTKIVQGSGISLSSTGVDSGTGDVTVGLGVSGLTEDTTPDLANDFVPTYDSSDSAHKKVKLSALSSSGIAGSGTAGTLAKFTASSTLGDSLLTESGTALSAAASLTLTAQPFTAVYKSADDAAFTRATDVAIGFNSETTDVTGMHDNATNNTRITAALAGVYVVTASVRLYEPSNWGNSDFGIFLRKNGTMKLNQAWLGKVATNATTFWLTASVVVSLAASDYVEVCVRQDNGPTPGTMTVKGGAASDTSFQVVKVA
jgi:hypothetical protein